MTEMETLNRGIANRNEIYLLLKVSASWLSAKQIRQQVKIGDSSVRCHLNTLMRQKLIEEKTFYKIIGGRGRKVRHYKIV